MASDVEALKVRRAALKGKLTRICTFVQAFDGQSRGIDEIQVRFNELGNLSDAYDSVQSQIELLDEKRDDPENKTNHEIERNLFETKYYSIKAKMETMISGQNGINSSTSSAHNSSTSNCSSGQGHDAARKCPVRLPKLELPKFDGDIRQWPAFRNIFYSSVDSADMPAVNKLQYLKSALTGEAAGLVSSLLIIEENYNKALDILAKRYENKTLIVNYHLKAITNFNVITRYNLKDFLVQLQQSLDSLKAIDLPVDQWDALLVFLISHKLDNSLRAAWEINRKENTLATLTELLDFLNLRRTAFEMLNDKTSGDKINIKTSHVTSANPDSTVSCILCQDNHALYKCPNYLQLSVPDRIQLLKTKSLCFNCLQPFRATHKCSKRKCFSCNGRHHTTIHIDKAIHQVSFTATDNSPCKGYEINQSHVSNPLIQQQPANNTASNASMSNVPCSFDKGQSNNHAQTSATLSTPSTVLVSNTANKNTILLSTAVIRVQDSSGKWINARALLDAGSEVNIATHRLASVLRLKPSNTACTIQGVGNSYKQTQECINTNIASRYYDQRYNLNFILMENITVPLPHAFIPTYTWQIPTKQVHNLADPTFFIPSTIDLLIGAEIFYSLLLIGRIKLGTNLPYLIETTLGWVVSGTCNQECPQDTSDTFPISLHISAPTTDSLLESFWEQEHLPQTKVLSPEDQYCEDLFETTTTTDSCGRYIVNLPIKSDQIPELGNSFNMAYRCLLKLESKMAKDPILFSQYKEFLDEYVRLGHAHYIDNFSPTDSQAYYIPHLAVLRPDSVTTKLRVVFNASNKTSSGLSLNAILFEGPNIYNNLLDILLRFRSHKVVFSCDIVKMFRGIRVNPQQTSLQRVLWRDSKTKPLKCIELDTVTYGTKCAPYLACRTLLDIGNKHRDTHSQAADCIKDSYMDDFLCGSSSPEKCVELCLELIDMLKTAGFELHKWSSNYTELYSHILKRNTSSKSSQTENDFQHNIAYNFTPPDSVKTLGLKWLPIEDTFQLSIPEPDSKLCTKRNILSQIAKIYDPIGILAPTTILAKILMQEIWKEDVDWDSPISNDLQLVWHKFANQLSSLKSIKIPRYYFHDLPISIVLIGFCDASKKAYGACLYLRACYDNKPPSCSLVTAKSRVAPIKKQSSIPRLELCGAHLLARLTKTFMNAINYKMRISQTLLFTDSSIVLSWIKAPYKNKTDTYVSHRLMQIIDTTKSEDWYYINTKQNPSDLITRGVAPDALQECSLWWQGSSWLVEDKNQWPISTTLSLDSDNVHSQSGVNQPDSKVVYLCEADSVSINISFFYELFCKFSNFSKLVRTVAYMFRFLHNIKGKEQKSTSHITISELQKAHNFIIKVIQSNSFQKEVYELQNIKTKSHTAMPTHASDTNAQTNYKIYTFTSSPLRKLNPFLDDQGLIRVGGRLSHSDIPYTQAHPIILPSKNHITSIIILHYHLKLLHSGLQNTLYNIRLKYWPINGRGEVKKCIYSCVRSTRYRGRVCGQQMSELPAPRVSLTRAFAHVGIDYSGAISIRSAMTRNCKYTKGYICLFVCLSSRAIHLELVTDLSSQAFICALKRFISRRGIPNCIYSDNATNFKGARSELHDLYKMFKNERCYSEIVDFCTSNAIEFKFTIPLASHMGGIYEAGIKSVKSLLKRHLFSTKLTYELLYTILVQIEGILNSRPLSPLHDLPTDLNCLTPAHFIIGAAITDLPEPSVLDLKESRLNMYQKVIQIKQKFWKQFYLSYISELQVRNKWLKIQNNLKIGNLVLLKDECTSPTLWPLGRVISTNVNKSDGLIRSVIVLTNKGEFVRPIHKLVLLPLN